MKCINIIMFCAMASLCCSAHARTLEPLESSIGDYTEAAIDRFLKDHDKDGNGKFEKAEDATLWKRNQRLDENGDGALDREELPRVLKYVDSPGKQLRNVCFKREGTRQVYLDFYFPDVDESGYIGKHHATVGPQKERQSYMKENIDFCYMKGGHLGFDLMKYKEFQNLKVGSQIEGLFEATEAFMRPGKDKDYFFENAHASVADFLHRRDTSKPFALSLNVNLPHASSIGGMGANPKHPEMYRTLYNDVQNDFAFPPGYPNIQVPLPDNVFRQDELMDYYHTTNQPKLLDKKTKMARAVTAIDIRGKAWCR